MRAEVIAIGDELTSGQRLDTNSQWLSQQLGDLGVHVLFHTTVGDDLSANMDVFRVAARRADIVVCTGGLGPTADDLTRQAMANAFDLSLELDPIALQQIEAMFAKRSRQMPERNKLQAEFPTGARRIDNPHGTAPGVDLTIGTNGQKSRIFALPGVPAEMREMFLQTVATRLKDEMGVGQSQRFFHEIKMFGIGESDVEARIPDLISRDRDPRVGITVSRATITLRVSVTAESENQSVEMMRPTIDSITSEFGDLVFGTAGDELHDAVGRILAERQETLAVVELGPESLIGNWFRNSKFGSVLTCSQTYENPFAAHRACGLAAEPPHRDEGFMKLADYIRKTHQSDWALMIGPYPDRTAVNNQVSLPAYTVPIVISSRTSNSQLIEKTMGGHPNILYHRLAKSGLDLLRTKLIDQGC